MPTFLILLALHGASTAPCDTIVVCPQEFRAALAPWVEYRAAQGHRLEFVSNLLSAEQIRAEIRQRAAVEPVRFVLLVGDADPLMTQDASVRARCVPTHRAAARIISRWGPDTHIATDNYYADLNGDRVPELAVGRLTADSPAALRQIVAKILAYERCPDYGAWRRQINIVAGLGGFGQITDAVIESTTKFVLTEGISPAYATTMTYAGWRSPYCPDPRAFRQTTLDRLNEGCLFWVYLGHGQPYGLDEMPFARDRQPILSVRDMRQLNCRRGAAIACLFCCYTGAFDQREDCLAEEMLRAPAAPVAVVCGSRVTMPYGMAILGTGLLDQYFQAKPETLGEALLAAKQNLVSSKKVELASRGTIEMLASLLSPSPADLGAERAEHLDLFNLLGDPLLRMRYPRDVKLEVARVVAGGETLEVAGASEVDGVCDVELVAPRDRLTFRPPVRSAFESSHEALAAYTNIYQRANDPRWTMTQVEARGGRFLARLSVPNEAVGDCHVRVWIEGAGQCAAGAAKVEVETTPRPAGLSRAED